jgi:hypothetical protein
MIRKCQYRNCNKDISEMRNNSKYCCRRHKEIEYVYRKRMTKKGEQIFLYIINEDKLV